MININPKVIFYNYIQSMAVSAEMQVILALSVVVLIICIIIKPSISTIICLITCLGIAYSSSMQSVEEPSKFAVSSVDSVIESLGAQVAAPVAAPVAYQGAIDSEINDDLEWPPTEMGDVNLNRMTGTFDRPAVSQDTAGNFYNYGRSDADSAAVCIDNEANSDELDADELNTYQVRSRNDPVRATAGTMNRQRDIDRYLRNEVDEAEDRYWWGRQER